VCNSYQDGVEMDAGSGARWGRLDGNIVVPLSDAEVDAVLAGGGTFHEPVAFTKFPWGTSVSTVFMGLRTGNADRAALWFETTVLGGGDELTRQHWRHATYFEAIEGHQIVIGEVIRERHGRAWQLYKNRDGSKRGRLATG
jgi:hypothetical protein